MMGTNDLYREAIDRYGADAQCVVAVEELSELQKELCKHLRGGVRIVRDQFQQIVFVRLADLLTKARLFSLAFARP